MEYRDKPPHRLMRPPGTRKSRFRPAAWPMRRNPAWAMFKAMSQLQARNPSQASARGAALRAGLLRSQHAAGVLRAVPASRRHLWPAVCLGRVFLLVAVADHIANTAGRSSIFDALNDMRQREIRRNPRHCSSFRKTNDSSNPPEHRL